MIIIAHNLLNFFFIVNVFVVLRFHSSITTQKLNTLAGFYANKGRLEKKKKKVGTWKKICQMYARDTFSSSGKTFWS